MSEASLVIDTTAHNRSSDQSSLTILEGYVAETLKGASRCADVKSLRLIGSWAPARPNGDHSPVDSAIGGLRPSSVSSAETDVHAKTIHTRSPLGIGESIEQDWSAGISSINSLLTQLRNLERVEWFTQLPFSRKLWPCIPLQLKHLAIDISICNPVDGQILKRQAFLQQSHLKPLTEFRQLETLFLYGMMESYQPIIWETVFRNQNLHTLGLHMVFEPLCREGDGARPWPRIEERLIQTGENEDMETEYRQADERRTAPSFADSSQLYRGIEGTGHLHHKYGHGEYLDVVAIRQARIKVGLVELAAGLKLPLKTLRLEGFVVDALPFNQGCFDHLERVEFFANCYDAGFALPANLRDKVEVSTTQKEDGDSDSISVRTFDRDELQLITETFGELRLKSKSVTDLSRGLLQAAQSTPNMSSKESDTDRVGVAESDQRNFGGSNKQKKTIKRPRFLEARSSSFTG